MTYNSRYNIDKLLETFFQMHPMCLQIPIQFHLVLYALYLLYLRTVIERVLLLIHLGNKTDKFSTWDGPFWPSKQLQPSRHALNQVLALQCQSCSMLPPLSHSSNIPVIIADASLKISFQNLQVKIILPSILQAHPTLCIACIPRLSQTLHKLQTSLNQSVTQALPAFFQAHFFPSDLKQLIWSHQTIQPSSSSPEFSAGGPKQIQPLLPVFQGEKWLLLLTTALIPDNNGQQR